MIQSIRQEYDVVIIGAGPSGTAAAAILAEKGYRVLALEKGSFPRYCVGESLIPFTYHPLKRLGLIDSLKRSAFVKKHSVQFVAPSGNASQPFYFNTRYDDNVSQTWQVLRSEFDQMMVEKAQSNGAEIRQNTQVRKLIREEGKCVGVIARNESGDEYEVRAPMTLDCSGREAFTAVRNGWRMGDPLLNKVAVWTYYKGAKRDEGMDAGATTVAYVPEKGWFWFIPQHNDQVSVGVVAEGKYLSRDGVKKPKDIFEREIKQNKWIEDRLSTGEQFGPHYITGEYSFRSRYCAEDGLLLVGDAFGFLDPVFSSGLLLALKSGVMAGDAVDRALREKNYAAAQFEDYGAQLMEGIENMRKLVYAFYDENFSFAALTKKYPELHGDLTDCLSGDVNKDFSNLFAKVAEFAEVPESLPYGGPKPSQAQVDEQAPGEEPASVTSAQATSA